MLKTLGICIKQQQTTNNKQKYFYKQQKDNNCFKTPNFTKEQISREFPNEQHEFVSQTLYS